MMRRIFHHIGLYALLLAVASCGSTLWDDVPEPIRQFISTYWPGVTVSDYEQLADGSYTATIKRGASLAFDADYRWTRIDGRGVALPAILIYNEMPAIYEYLEAREQTSDLLLAVSDPTAITLTFGDFTLQYDKATGAIRMVQSEAAGAAP